MVISADIYVDLLDAVFEMTLAKIFEMLCYEILNVPQHAFVDSFAQF